MGDVNSTSFITPYPPEDVYGLGVAGPPPQSAQQTGKAENPDNGNETSNENNENVNSNNNVEKPIIEENLGQNIDTTV